MVKDVQKAFFRRIESLTWMDEDSKNQAIDKASSMMTKIAYPDKLLNHTYVGNTIENVSMILIASSDNASSVIDS
jgi:predicted metalloendopeptidase